VASAARLRRAVRIWWALQRAAVRSRLQYRLDLLIGILMGIAYQGSGFAFVWIVLARFHTLGGWTFGQVGFLYGMRLVAHALWLVPFGSVSIGLDRVVREGEFDRYLLRPVNPLVQAMTADARTGPFGDLVTGVGILAAAASRAGVDWSPLALGYCALAVAGGALVECSAQLALSALTFRLLETQPLRWFVDDLFSYFGSYPMRIFGTGTEWALTVVVPVAFVAYLPASVLLGRSDQLRVAPAVAYAAPLLGVMTFGLAYRLWKGQLRAYQSSGH
jgi:ABC-2 type transport system permease protein